MISNRPQVTSKKESTMKTSKKDVKQDGEEVPMSYSRREAFAALRKYGLAAGAVTVALTSDDALKVAAASCSVPVVPCPDPDD